MGPKLCSASQDLTHLVEEVVEDRVDWYSGETKEALPKVLKEGADVARFGKSSDGTGRTKREDGQSKTACLVGWKN